MKLPFFRFFCFLLVALPLAVVAQVDPAGKALPKPFELTADTAMYLMIPDSNWQYLLENKRLTLDQVLSPQYTTLFKNGDTADKAYRDFWLRFKIKNKLDKEVSIAIPGGIRGDIYITGADKKWHHFRNGDDVPMSLRDGLKLYSSVLYTLPANGEIIVYKRDENYRSTRSLPPYIYIEKSLLRDYMDNPAEYKDEMLSATLFGFLIFAALFNLFFFFIIREKVYVWYSIMLVLAGVVIIRYPYFRLFGEYPGFAYHLFYLSLCSAVTLSVVVTLMFLNVRANYPRLYKALMALNILSNSILLLYFIHARERILLGTDDYFDFLISYLPLILEAGILGVVISDLFKKRRSARIFMLAALPYLICFPLYVANFDFLPAWISALVPVTEVWAVIIISWSLFIRYKGVVNESLRQSLEKEHLLREKERERNELIAQQNELLERQVAERTAELQASLEHLKRAQTRLIQSEKMASLGELTAGIAHEIQNPLNFVNNFSEVSRELLTEMREELAAGNMEDVNDIAADLDQNLEKINHHGKRADAIVKGMLQHSRTGSNNKTLTDINKLADEYLRLAYHGFKAKDKAFNVTIETAFDENLPHVEAVGQDIGRVMLNMFNNAFYAVQQRQRMADADHKPTVSARTSIENNVCIITIKDNGVGIPDAIREKIMQPFFTTKPTGEGTGLGLSLSYDIVVKVHGGTIDVTSSPGEYTEFKITLPVKAQ